MSTPPNQFRSIGFLSPKDELLDSEIYIDYFGVPLLEREFNALRDLSLVFNNCFPLLIGKIADFTLPETAFKKYQIGVYIRKGRIILLNCPKLEDRQNKVSIRSVLSYPVEQKFQADQKAQKRKYKSNLIPPETISVPYSILNLSHLEYLNGDNYVFDNEISIAQLVDPNSPIPSLERFTILDCFLNIHAIINGYTEDFTISIENYHVIYCRFDSTSLTSLPHSIGNWIYLERLELKNNLFTDLPPTVVQLTQLKELTLYDNQSSPFTKIPDVVFELTQLKKLNFSINNIRIIPPHIGNLISLESVFFSLNHIESLPKEIGLLQSLKSLSLAVNKIRLIPSEISSLINLEELNLSSNELATFPIEICFLQNLQKLNLSDNRISIIPPEIRNLQNLIELNLEHNQITEIPPDIGKLINLKELVLGNNPIQYFSNEVGNCKLLERLIMKNSSIFGAQWNTDSPFQYSLPESLLSLTHLQKIDIPADIYENYDAAFNSIIEKIKNNATLNALEKNHPKLLQWGGIFEDLCYKTISNLSISSRNESTAIELLKILAAKGFIGKWNSDPKLKIWL